MCLVCLFVCLFDCLSVCLFVCLFVCLLVRCLFLVLVSFLAAAAVVVAVLLFLLIVVARVSAQLIYIGLLLQSRRHLATSSHAIFHTHWCAVTVLGPLFFCRCAGENSLVPVAGIPKGDWNQQREETPGIQMDSWDPKGRQKGTLGMPMDSVAKGFQKGTLGTPSCHSPTNVQGCPVYRRGYGILPTANSVSGPSII